MTTIDGTQVKNLDHYLQQYALQSKGFYKGELDGDFGPQSRKARAAWETSLLPRAFDGTFSGPIKSAVFNRGIASDAFLTEMVAWGKTAPESLFAPNPKADIYGKTILELGPWRSPLHRRAAMLEVMRVLAGFESSWRWNEGTDVSKAISNTSENAEAGAWQVSYDARRLSPELDSLLVSHGIRNGVQFQQAMKSDHNLAMTFVATLLRHNTRHNGPLYKGSEREVIRKSLRGPEHSIYPWLKRAAVEQFMELLS